MIDLHDVSKVYQIGEERVHALDHVTLHIYPKEFVSVIGPSGSGIFRVGKIESTPPDITICVSSTFELIEVHICAVICFKIVPSSHCCITNHPFGLIHISGFNG